MRVLLALLLLTSAAHAVTPTPSTPAPRTTGDRQAIRRTVKRHMTKIVACWELHDVNARRIVLAFTIATSGRVTLLTTTGGTKPLQDCIAGVVMRMKFPAAKDVVHVTYPLQICTAGS